MRLFESLDTEFKRGDINTAFEFWKIWIFAEEWIEKFQKFSDYWSPKVIAELNDYQFKLVKIKGEFIWHNHENTDEAFIVLEGKIFIEFEQKTEEINEGEMIVVPKGIKHKPYADSEAKIMIIEPKGVINTGDIKDKLTAPNDDWI